MPSVHQDSAAPSSEADNNFETGMKALRSQMPTLFIFSFLANALLLASSIYMLQVFDRVLSSGSLDTLIWLTVIALGAILAYGLMEQARRQLLSRAGVWLDSELSGPVLRRGVRARLAQTAPDAGLGDLGDLRKFVAGEGVLAFLDAPWSPVFIALIWFMHPALGVIAAGGAVLLFIVAVVNDLLTRKRTQLVGQDARLAAQSAQQIMDGAPTVAALGMSEPMVRQWQERRRKAELDGLQTGDITASLFNTSRSLRLALQVLILGVGAYYVLQGQITGGAMIAASIILGRALSPVERSISAWRSFVAARSAYNSLANLFARTEARERLRLPTPEGKLVVDGVRFVPPDTGKPILNKIDFRLQPGEICGIIGPSGAGKSTLSRLIVGAWSPSDGCVRLDGADVAQWDDDDLGRHIGYLPQQVDLFAGTIAENIARMREADDTDIIAAARKADVHEMILRMPQGYETDVGAFGHKLSGGQRQRLGLARALFGDPRLIVLDEPSSNLDGEGEAALMRALAELKAAARTVIVITHQSNLLRGADKILVLREGAVAAFGPRESLMKAAPAATARGPLTAAAFARPSAAQPAVPSTPPSE